MEKRLLFRITKEDCDWQTFRCGGNGGQNVNKVESGVRCIHRASGAVAQSCDTRDQFRNRRSAFKRMTETPEFKAWHKLETARRMGQPSIDELVDRAMDERNLIIEFRDENGRYQKESGHSA